MSNLERWNPFKFRRKATEEKKSEEAKAEAPSHLAPFFGSGPMARFAESFFSDPFFREHGRADLDRWFGDFSAATFRPKVDVVDEESHLRVSAELPGMDKSDLDVSIDRDVLTIRGEKKNFEEKRENGCYRTERTYGMFARSIPLPHDLDHESAQATFDKGVLSIRFQKAPQKGDTPKKIAIA